MSQTFESIEMKAKIDWMHFGQEFAGVDSVTQAEFFTGFAEAIALLPAGSIQLGYIAISIDEKDLEKVIQTLETLLVAVREKSS